jgi:hypothetical protein
VHPVRERLGSVSCRLLAVARVPRLAGKFVTRHTNRRTNGRGSATSRGRRAVVAGY